MWKSTRQQLLAGVRNLRRTGRYPDGERPIGAALAARLPKSREVSKLDVPPFEP